MLALNASFSVVLQLKLPPHVGDSTDSYVDGVKNSPKTRSAITAAQEVTITLNGTSREASEAASRRISMMKTSDLIRVTFDPLPADDDDFSSPVSSTNGSPSGHRSMSLTGAGKINDTYSTLNMIAEGRSDDIDFGIAGEMIDIIPASTRTAAVPPLKILPQAAQASTLIPLNVSKGIDRKSVV